MAESPDDALRGRRVLLTGGTGTLGRIVAGGLHAVGAQVTVASREAGAGRQVADLRRPADTLAVVDGREVVIHCASRPGDDIGIARTLIDAAERARIAHLVFVSIVGVDRMPLAYYREKLAVERLLAASDVPHTVLRATQFHGFVDAALARLARGPVVVVPRATPLQPIDPADVARLLIVAAARRPLGKVTEIGGPQTLDIDVLARLWVGGSRRRVVGLRLPGRLAAAARAGGLTTSHHLDTASTYAHHISRGTTT